MPLYVQTGPTLAQLKASRLCRIPSAPLQERARSLGGYVDFITVLRPDPAGGGRLAPVRLPTGGVRASLGSLSRFEDVYALAEFLEATYVM